MPPAGRAEKTREKSRAARPCPRVTESAPTPACPATACLCCTSLPSRPARVVPVAGCARPHHAPPLSLKRGRIFFQPAHCTYAFFIFPQPAPIQKLPAYAQNLPPISKLRYCATISSRFACYEALYVVEVMYVYAEVHAEFAQAERGWRA